MIRVTDDPSKEGCMSPEDPQKVPEDLVQEMVEKLERESNLDWTREFPASGAKGQSSVIMTTMAPVP
jgi:hypothetical protein